MTTLTIRDDLPPRNISSDLWGVFFEDLNYAADGGLYAELVQNRSFAYSQADHHGWGPLTGWARDGRVEIHRDDPVSPKAPNYIRLVAGGASASITNEGFDGIVVAAGESYVFSLFARAASRVELYVTLTSPAGATTAKVHVMSVAWKHHSIVLSPTFSAADTQLQIEVLGDDVIDIDFVSLFPAKTFRSEKNGLRADLATAINELRPRFVRFPGGCVAHGLGLENLYRWKDTIGELHERTQNFNLWGYHQSMGIGYYEYFLFCEQLGATALPVLAAGVCCQNLAGGPDAIPLDQMDAYIKDVLDLVEFANGPAASEWGARRAQLGHPEPFGLRYLAVGNEDKINATFRNRFELIFAAVREAHPEIEIIGTAGPAPFGTDYERGWEFARELDIAIVDEHMYRSPKWFFENTDRYDSYDRSGPQVYVGEYGSKGNRLINALAEAAFMVGMERNGDIVRLASYAPLLAKRGHTQWVPDLIYFDNERVLPSLNYYVQQMFARSSGDQYQHVDITAAPAFTRLSQQFSTIAFESTGLDVKFEGIELNGQTAPDMLLSPGGQADIALHVEDEDYTIRLKATAIAGDSEGTFAIHFGAVGTGNSFEWNFGTWKNRALTAFYAADGDRDELMEPQGFSVEIGRTYDVELRVFGRGQRIEYLLDGRPFQTFDAPGRTEQRFLASTITDSATRARHVHIVNATDEPTEASIVDAKGAELTVRSITSLHGTWDAGAAFESAPFLPESLQPNGNRVAIPPFSFTVVELAN